MNVRLPAVALLVSALAGCGDNVQSPVEVSDLPAPEALTALSVNGATVRLAWRRPAGVPDSLLRGWVVTRPGGADSLGPAVLTADADSLPGGAADFEVRIRSTQGRYGPPARIRWAPAARFDAGVLLTEYYASQPDRQAGMDAGDAVRDPSAFAIGPAAGEIMDVYLFGGEGEVEAPLELRSASMYLGSWNVTLFSTVTHPSPDLNLPLDRFPAAASFTETSLPVTDNMICYARLSSAGGIVHVARLHVRTTGGSQRARTVQVRVSLQRQPGVPYAAAVAPFPDRA